MKTEKRKSKRFKISPSPKVSLKETDGFIVDISLYGLLVKSPIYFDTNAEIKLIFSLPVKNKKLKITCSSIVRWINKVDKNNLLGLYFTKLNSKNKKNITRYIEETQKRE